MKSWIFSVKLWNFFFNEFFLPEAPMAWIQFRSHRLLLSSKEEVTSEFLSYLIQACHYRVGCKRAWHFLLLSLQRRKHPNSVPVSPIGYSTIIPISFNNKNSEKYYGYLVFSLKHASLKNHNPYFYAVKRVLFIKKICSVFLACFTLNILILKSKSDVVFDLFGPRLIRNVFSRECS